MIPAFGSALSALSAFGTRMNVTANNVANVNTDEFKKSRTIMREKSPNGVEALVDRVDTSAPTRPVEQNGATAEVEMSNVDLGEELTDLITTPKAYAANSKTIQAADEMVGTLLNIKG